VLAQNAENGHPSCANSFLLNDVLRKRWQRSDAYITTDCTAVSNTMGPPLSLKTKEEAAAATINAGTDLEMGSDIWCGKQTLRLHEKYLGNRLPR
jgi:beta-glucosidase-like glycosyl hydrolase